MSNNMNFSEVYENLKLVINTLYSILNFYNFYNFTFDRNDKNCQIKRHRECEWVININPNRHVIILNGRNYINSISSKNHSVYKEAYLVPEILIGEYNLQTIKINRNYVTEMTVQNYAYGNFDYSECVKVEGFHHYFRRNLSKSKLPHSYAFGDAVEKVFYLIDKFKFFSLYDYEGNIKYNIELKTIDNIITIYCHDVNKNILYSNNKNINTKDISYLVHNNHEDYYIDVELSKIIKNLKNGKQIKVREEYEKNSEFKDGPYPYALNNDIFDICKQIKTEWYDENNIKNYNLHFVDFDGANISRMNFSQNHEAKININKIIKDLTNTNLEGYNLKNIVLRNFNLTNTNLLNTGAIIDIDTCTINTEGKIGTGTLLDDKNQFISKNKKLTKKQIDNKGINILRR